MEGEGRAPSAETGVSVGPTVEATVSQPVLNPEIDSLGALKDKVEQLQELRAQTEGPPEAPEVEPVTPTGVEGLGQEHVKGVGGLGQAQEAEVQVPAGPEGKLAPETEAQAPTQEAPRVPGKLASDTGYIRIVGERYSKLKQQGVSITKEQINQVTEQSLSEYYDNLAKTEIGKGLTEEVKSDPLYNQKLGEAMQVAQEKGEPLEANKLSQEALAKYQQEKDLQAEAAEGSQTEQMTTDQRLQEIEQRIGALIENQGSRLESAQVTLSAKDLASLLKALAEAKEPNPKKKENKLMLLLKLLGLLGLATVAEAGKQAGQEAGGKR